MESQASKAFKCACDRGHSWIMNRAEKLKTDKSGYNKIRPIILFKGLSTFKQEHCEDIEEPQTFLSKRERNLSVDIADCRLRAEKNENFVDLRNKRFSRSMDFREIDDSDIDKQRKEEALPTSPNIELKVVANARDKRRKSLQNTKLFVTSNEENDLKILPSVLLTYNEKFVKIGEKPCDLKFTESVLVLQDRLELDNSTDA